MKSAFLRAFVLTASMIAAAAATNSRAEEQVTVDCPAYVVHLVSAQTKLQRGNRPAAHDEMEQAKAALRECLREQSTETALAARQPEPVCDQDSNA